ncbi:hypothetical protein MICRO11B_290102 [Micrococcus luteus]|nr:hypothetical protein MICRO11B_290102 [Micrococcus luteus]
MHSRTDLQAPPIGPSNSDESQETTSPLTCPLGHAD